MRVDVKIDIDVDKLLKAYKSSNFGLLLANEWKRLIDPYTPRDTGLMQDTAKISPFRIVYDAGKTAGKSYATYVYHGYHMNFQKKNPFSTYEWDKAAASAGQVENLARTVQNYIRED